MNQRFIVEFVESTSKQVMIDKLKKIGAKTRYIYQLIPAAAIESSENQASLIEKDNCVVKVSPDYCSQPSEPIDVRVQLEDGTISYINFETTNSQSDTENSVLRQYKPMSKIAVLDTGADKDHPTLIGKIDSEVDFTGEGPFDYHGHGTMVASLAAKNFDKIAIVKAANRDGVFWESDVMKGIEWAATNKIDIVNLSLGIYRGDCDGQCPICAMTKAAADKILQFFVAAGNNPGYTPCPAKLALKGFYQVVAVEALVDGILDPLSGKGTAQAESQITMRPVRNPMKYETINVDIPHGVSRDGSWVQKVSLRELNGFDQSYIIRKSHVPKSIKTTELLRRTVQFKNVTNEEKIQIIRNLTIGDRLALLINLRAQIADPLKLTVTCPSCKYRSEIILSAKDLLVPKEKEPQNEYTVNVENFLLRVRPITGADLEMVESQDISLVEKLLVSSCIISSEPTFPEKPEKSLLAAVMNKIGEFDKQANLNAGIYCLSCNSHYNLPFNFESIFYQEQEMLSSVTKNEVYTIKAKTGSTVEEVMALPISDRKKQFASLNRPPEQTE